MFLFFVYVCVFLLSNFIRTCLKFLQKQRKRTNIMDPETAEVGEFSEIDECDDQEVSFVSGTADNAENLQYDPTLYYTQQQQLQPETSFYYQQPSTFLWNGAESVMEPQVQETQPQPHPQPQQQPRQRRRRGGRRIRQQNLSQATQSTPYLNRVVCGTATALFESRNCRISPRTVASRIRELLVLNGTIGPDELFNGCQFVRQVCVELLMHRDIGRYGRRD